MWRRSCFYLLLYFVVFQTYKASAQVQRFYINPDTSQISAKIKDPFGNTVDGKLRIRQGEAHGELNRLRETGSVSLVIETGSYNSNLGLRDQDVQEFYLQVKEYPTIRFDSTAVLKDQRPQSSETPWQITLKGQLELHGVRRKVIIPIRILYREKTIDAQGSFRLLLEDFNITVPRLLFLTAGNQVDVDFRIIGEKKP